MGADQTFAVKENFNLSYESSKVDETSVIEENSNLFRESSAFLPSMHGFKLASLNIASLPQHIDKLQVLLSDNPLDLLDETRLDDSASDDEIYIPGYNITLRDCEHNSRFGGGVCIYVQPKINFSLHLDLSDIHLEHICIKIHKPRSKPFLIATS